MGAIRYEKLKFGIYIIGTWYIALAVGKTIKKIQI